MKVFIISETHSAPILGCENIGIKVSQLLILALWWAPSIHSHRTYDNLKGPRAGMGLNLVFFFFWHYLNTIFDTPDTHRIIWDYLNPILRENNQPLFYYPGTSLLEFSSTILANQNVQNRTRIRPILDLYMGRI